MIILCRFFLLSLHKTFLPLHNMLTHAQLKKDTTHHEIVRVRSCSVEAFEITLAVAPALESSSLSSDTYFFHHINNIPHSTQRRSYAAYPPRQTHMKWGWIGNYYVVNITHPTAYSLNETCTKYCDEYVCTFRWVTVWLHFDFSFIFLSWKLSWNSIHPTKSTSTSSLHNCSV